MGSQLTHEQAMDQLLAHPQLAPQAEYLCAHYGDQSLHIADYGHDAADFAPLLEGIPITPAQIRYTVAHEYVRKPLDFLVRRSGLGLIEQDKTHTLLPEVTRIMAEEFSWDDTTKKAMEEEASQLLSASI
jgi:glycerol-3-phosphate dehydrogenase